MPCLNHDGETVSMRRAQRRGQGLAAVIRAAALAMVASVVAAPAFALDDVTVGLSVQPSVSDGGAWALADELGIWKKEGLSVKTVVFSGSGTLIPQVAAGQILIGLPDPASIVVATAAGQARLPLTFFYNEIPLNTLEFAVLASSPIKTVADLKGKKIGVGALTWGNIPTTRAVFKSAGLDGQYSLVPVGSLGSGFQALKSGGVDALNFNSGWNDQLELSGTPLRRVHLPGVFGRISLNAFVTRNDELARNPDLFARFGRAFTEAQFVCDANPAACIDAFWRAHPEARPAGPDVEQARKTAIEVLRRHNVAILYWPDGRRRTPGEFDLRNIHEYVRQMAAQGELASANVPVDTLFSNALVPQFDRFDHAALRAEAQAKQ